MSAYGNALPMKTDRLTLLIAPADKAAIAARADELGLSVSELVRRATVAYEPEDEALVRELDALWPEVGAALDRIEANLDRALARSAEHATRMNWIASDEYRDQVRRGIESDPSIDWSHIRRLLKNASARRDVAA